MRKTVLLCIFLFTSAFSQYGIQSINPSVDLGWIGQVEYISDTKVIVASTKQNTLQVYAVNQQVEGGAPALLFSEYSAGWTYLVQKMKFFTALDGYIYYTRNNSSGGTSKVLLKTSDGGNNWIQLYIGYEINKLDMSSMTRGALITNSGGLYLTSDGGIIWTAATEINRPWRNLYLVAHNASSWILTYSTDTLWISNDNGVSWSTLSLPYSTFGSAYALESYGANKFGYATGDRWIIRIEVGAEGYTTEQIRRNFGIIDGISFSDSAYAILTTSDSVYIYNNYTPQITSYYHKYTEGVKVKSATRSMLRGQYSSTILLVSENGGNSYRPINGFATEVWAVDFVTSSVGYIAGYNGPSLKTTDGGKNWRNIYTPPAGSFVYDIVAPTENTVYQREYSSSSRSRLLKSFDGGTTWSYITPSVNNLVSSFQFLDAFNGYFTGDGGRIYATIDGGTTWNEIHRSPYGDVSAIYFLNRTTGFAQSGTKFLKTTTGGVLWDTVSNNFYGAIKIKFVNSSVGYMLSGNPYYFGKTTNGGTTWNWFTGTGYWDFDVADENNIFLLNYYGSVSHSTNGGTSFSLIPDAGFYPQRIDLINNRTAIFTAYSNKIQKILYSPGNVIAMSQFNAIAGDTIEVPVELHIAPGRQYQSVQFNISGYTDKLQFISSHTENTLLSGGEWIHSINTAANTIRFAASAPSSIMSSGTLLKLKFKVSNSAAGNIPLNFSSVLFNTGVVPTDTVNGNIKVETVNLGDVDVNGTVQAFDASLVLQYLTLPGGIPLSNVQRRNANVTTDNTISALDASVILRYVTGIITTLPYGGTETAAGSVVMNDQISSPGALLEIPVRITGGTNIYSFEGAFTYDAALLEYNSIQWQPVVAGLMKESKAFGNRVYIAGAGLQRMDNLQNVEIAKLYFTIKPTAGQTHTQVVMEKLRLNENAVVQNAASSGISITTSINEPGTTPENYTLLQNYPNPFNPETRIVYGIPQEGRVVLELFDVMGRSIAVLSDDYKNAGYHVYTLNTAIISGMTSGIYFYRITSGSFTDVKKLVLLK